MNSFQFRWIVLECPATIYIFTSIIIFQRIIVNYTYFTVVINELLLIPCGRKLVSNRWKTRVQVFHIQRPCSQALNLPTRKFAQRKSKVIAKPLVFPLFINPRSLLEKIVTRSLEGGGGVNQTPPSTFDTIHPIHGLT